MADISKEQVVQLAREAGIHVPSDASHSHAALERFAKSLIKLGRNSGMEEAKRFFQDNDTNLFWGSQAASHIESLKDNTP